jgi:hypothetical protein
VALVGLYTDPEHMMADDGEAQVHVPTLGRPRGGVGSNGLLDLTEPTTRSDHRIVVVVLPALRPTGCGDS